MNNVQKDRTHYQGCWMYHKECAVYWLEKIIANVRVQNMNELNSIVLAMTKGVDLEVLNIPNDVTS